MHLIEKTRAFRVTPFHRRTGRYCPRVEKKPDAQKHDFIGKTRVFRVLLLQRRVEKSGLGSARSDTFENDRPIRLKFFKTVPDSAR